LDRVIVRAKSVVELTSNGGFLEDLLKSGNEGGEPTMCACQGIVAWIVKDAVFGVEATKSLDITLTDQFNLPPSQQFVLVHARHLFPQLLLTPWCQGSRDQPEIAWVDLPNFEPGKLKPF
jgi:hypothetical protein